MQITGPRRFASPCREVGSPLWRSGVGIAGDQNKIHDATGRGFHLPGRCCICRASSQARFRSLVYFLRRRRNGGFGGIGDEFLTSMLPRNRDSGIGAILVGDFIP